jgi:hypothetical protein
MNRIIRKIKIWTTEINCLILGLSVGCIVTVAFYSVYLSFTRDDCLKQQAKLANKLLPPDSEEFESLIASMDNLNRAFAYMDYNSLIELRYNGQGGRPWKPRKITHTKPTYYEYKSLHEFKLANKGYDEYLALLRVKYEKEIPLYPLLYWFNQNDINNNKNKQLNNNK